ncbi:Ser/Thr protein phosphatase [Amanita muscaria]
MQSPLNRHQHHTKILDTSHGRILCIADIRGRLSALNDLARDAHAHAIIHTGDFGFFESQSIERIHDRTLRHLAMYSPLIPSAQRTHLLSQDNPPSLVRSTVNIAMLSEFPLLLSGQIKLQVPVYTVWGACEDVLVLEKFRSKAYVVENLHVIDEATTRLIDVGGVKLRLLGLGGALVPHKMFDNGDGNATIAGGQGTMWTTALQIGELVDTAQRVFDSTETRLLITHASPGREGIIAQLALVLKADLTVSAGLHFRYATSYNEFSVQGDFEGFRHKLAVGKETFDKVWGSVKSQVETVIDDNQRILLDKALSVVDRIPSTQPSTGPGATATGEEPAWKNCWNWNLCDAAYGSLVLDIKEGRISAELKSQGFNYAYRRTATMATTPNSTSTALPPHSNISSSQPPTKGHTPAPDHPASLVAETNKANVHTSPPVTTAVLAPPSPTQDVKLNGNTAFEKIDKDKSKKKDKKDRRERRDGGTSTPEVPASTSTPTPSEPAPPPPDTGKQEAEESKSPTESMGVRTPKTNRPPRHPWTIFMRLSNQITVNEGDIKEFFGEAQGGITRVTIPTPYPGKPNKVAFVEFGDEDAMKNGLEKHAEKLKDTIPEVKQASDKESRTDHHSLRGPRGGRRGGYVARGLSAAGLTRRHDNRDSGEAGPVKTSNGIENT